MFRIRRLTSEEGKKFEKDTSNSRRKKFSKYFKKLSKALAGIAAAAVLGATNTGCSSFTLNPLPPLDAGPDSSVYDGGQDAEASVQLDAEASVPDARPDASDAALDDGSVDAADSSVVCSPQADMVTTDIPMGQVVTVGNLGHRNMDYSPTPPEVTVDIECDGGQKAVVGVQLTVGQAHIEPVEGYNVRYVVSSADGGTMNVAITITPQ